MSARFGHVLKNGFYSGLESMILNDVRPNSRVINVLMSLVVYSKDNSQSDWSEDRMHLERHSTVVQNKSQVSIHVLVLIHYPCL